MSTLPSLNLNYGDSVVTTFPTVVQNGLSLLSYDVPSVGFTTTENIHVVDNLLVSNTDATITVPSFKVEKLMSLPLVPNPSLSGSILSSLLSSLSIPLTTVVQVLVGVFTGCESLTSPSDTRWYFTLNGSNINVFNFPISIPNISQTTYLLMRTLVNFTPGKIHHNIVIAAGTIAPADNVIIDNTGNFVVFSTNTNLTTYDGTNYILNNNYSLECKTIASQFSTYNVTFPANQHIPDGTFFSLQIVNPSVAGGFPFQLNSSGSEMDLIVNIPFPEGVCFSQSFTFGLGSFISGGNVLLTGTIFNPSTINELVFGRIVFDPKSLIPTGSVITFANPSACPIKVEKEMVSAMTQKTTIGLTACKGLALSKGTTFPAAYVLESNLEINDSFNIGSDFLLAKKSVIAKGSMIRSGASTIAGMSFTNPVVFSSGTVLTSTLTYPTDSQIPLTTSVSTATNLTQGYYFPNLSLSAGTLLPTGLSLFGKLKVDNSAGAYFASGFVFPSGSILSGGFTIPGNSSFKPSTTFHTYTLFSSGTSFPSGTSFGDGSVVPQIFPIPAGQRFRSGTTLPTGFIFKAGTTIPNSVNFISNDSTNSSGVNNFNVITIGGVSYYVIPSSSIILKNKVLPTGTFLSQQSNGTTTSSNFGTSTGAATLNIPAGAWAGLSGDVGGNDINLLPQITTTVSTLPGYIIDPSIVFLEDIQFMSDMLFPVTTTTNPLSYLTLSSDLITQVPTLLTCDYHITAPGMAEWPAGVPLPVSWTLSEVLTVPSDFTSIRPIQLGASSSTWINNIIPSGGFITLPPTATTLHYPIMISLQIAIGKAGFFAGSSTVPIYTGTGLNSYVTLPKSTILLLSATTTSDPTYITLTSSTGNLETCTPFTLNQTISIYSAFTMRKGTVAPIGAYLLATLNFPPGFSLPEGITLLHDSIISNDFTISENHINSFLQRGTVLAPNTILAKGTIFPGGMTLLSCAYMYPVKSLFQQFTIPVSSNLCKSFYYYQFVDDNVMVFTYQEQIKMILDWIKNQNGC